MDKDTIKDILIQGSLAGVSSVKLNWKGESTLSPHFYFACHTARVLSQSSAYIDRLTNSNFKFDTSKDDIFKGLACQTKVKVSFDSFLANVFEYQRAGGIHKVTLDNINKFYNWPGRKTELVIQAVRTKLNKDEDIEAQAKKLWPEATVSIRDMVAGRVEKDVTELEDKERAVRRQSCYQAHVRLIFNHEGKAFPCCPDIKEELCLGDIKKDSIWEIFGSEKAARLRRDLISKKAFNMDPCKNCSSFESYEGYKFNWSS